MNELIITMPTLAKRRIDLGEAEEAVIVEDTIIREEEPADETVEGGEAQSETE